MVTQNLYLSERNHFLKVDIDRDNYPISMTEVLTSEEISSSVYIRKSFRGTAFTSHFPLVKPASLIYPLVTFLISIKVEALNEKFGLKL